MLGNNPAYDPDSTPRHFECIFELFFAAAVAMDFERKVIRSTPSFAISELDDTTEIVAKYICTRLTS